MQFLFNDVALKNSTPLTFLVILRMNLGGRRSGVAKLSVVAPRSPYPETKLWPLLDLVWGQCSNLARTILEEERVHLLHCSRQISMVRLPIQQVLILIPERKTCLRFHQIGAAKQFKFKLCLLGLKMDLNSCFKLYFYIYIKDWNEIQTHLDAGNLVICRRH